MWITYRTIYAWRTPFTINAWNCAKSQENDENSAKGRRKRRGSNKKRNVKEEELQKKKYQQNCLKPCGNQKQMPKIHFRSNSNICPQLHNYNSHNVVVHTLHAHYNHSFCVLVPRLGFFACRVLFEQRFFRPRVIFYSFSIMTNKRSKYFVSQTFRHNVLYRYFITSTFLNGYGSVDLIMVAIVTHAFPANVHIEHINRSHARCAIPRMLSINTAAKKDLENEEWKDSLSANSGVEVQKQSTLIRCRFCWSHQRIDFNANVSL